MGTRTVTKFSKYLPLKPIANNVGTYSVVIMIPYSEWLALDAEAKSCNISRAGLARKLLVEALHHD